MTTHHSKPLAGVQINSMHAMSRGLISCILMNEGAGSGTWDSSIEKNHGTITGANWEGTQDGGALRFDGSSGDHVNLGQSGFLDGHSEFTMAVKVRQDITTQDQAFFWRGANAFNEVGAFTLYFDDAGSGYTNVFRFIIRDSAGTLDARTASGFALLTNVDHTIVVTAKTGEALKIYVNGVDETSSSSGVYDEVLPALAQDEVIGAASDGTNRLVDGSMEYFQAWDRALTADEIAMHYADPYAMFDYGFDPSSQYIAVVGGASIINQFQGSSMGADLYNGTLL